MANVAYSRWLLDIGQSEDWIALQIALSSCVIGYGVSARWLQADVSVDNPYRRWIESYNSDHYHKVMENTSGKLYFPSPPPQTNLASEVNGTDFLTQTW